MSVTLYQEGDSGLCLCEIVGQGKVNQDKGECRPVVVALLCFGIGL